MADLNSYPHAMETDQATGKPMQKVALTGNTLVEQKTQTNAVAGTLTFAEGVVFVEIVNRDTVNDGVFNVNGINITVPKDSVVDYRVGGTPRTTITVTGSTSYIVSRLV